MKKQLLFLTVMLLSIFSIQAQQISEYYRFEELSYNYVSFTGTEIITGESDDGQESIPLGFDFPYNGTTYNSVNVDVNGAVSFTSSSVSWINQLEGTSADKSDVIAPLWDDLQKLDADGGKIQYFQFSGGTKIEWSNVSWRDAGNTVSFTLYFYKSGNIGFWYGPNNSTNTRSASIGFNAGSTGTNFVSITPGSPATLSTSTANNDISTIDYPGEDTFYLFNYGPENNLCSNATNLTVGNIDATHTVSTLVGASDDNGNGFEEVWFTAVVPASGNLNFETFQFAGSSLTRTYIRAFSGSCSSLTNIATGNSGSGSGDFSKIELTGQNPGDIIYFNVEQSLNTDPNDKFEVLAYEPPPVNNDCANAINLTVGTSFDSNSIEGTLAGATSGTGFYPQVWYTATIPASGNLTIETDQATGSPMDDTFIEVWTGTCDSQTQIATDDNGGNGNFSKIELTGRTPGEIITIQVDKDISYSGVLAEFMISVYEIPPVNDECANAIDLTVGTNFDSNSVEGTLAGSTTTGTTHSYPQVWYTATVPATGNLTIETGQAPGSPMDDTFMPVFSGTCSTNMITYNDNIDNATNFFSKIVLTGRTPGEIITIEVDKDGDYSGVLAEFMISAYDPTVSVNTLNAESISIFPNPANDFLNINSELNIESISIFDISGKEVININSASNNNEINVSNLKTGVYFIRIIKEEGTYQTKFIKK